MDNIGLWIYIVFLVTAGIAGMVNSAKKKKRSSEMPDFPTNDTSPAEYPEEKKSFWDILQEMQQQMEQENAEPDVIIPEEKVVRKKHKTPPPVPFFAEKENVTSSIEKETSIPLFKEEEDTQDSSFRNIEELRKAIIYTEILNRKY